MSFGGPPEIQETNRDKSFGYVMSERHQNQSGTDFHFSKRTEWETEINQLSVAVDQMKADGAVIRDLTISNPTSCGFSELMSADWLEDLRVDENLNYAPDPRGCLNARQAVAQYYADKGITVSPEQIFLTSSTSEGYSYVFRLIADSGQRILFPRPSYPLFYFLGDLNDVGLDFYDLHYDQRWRVDAVSVREQITDQTRGVVVVNPNNPTGSYCEADDLTLLREVCGSSMALISDEVFLDYPVDGSASQSLAGHTEGLTFVLSGLSKVLAMPQMKMSWIVVSGAPDLAREAMSRLEVIADTYLSVSAPVQNAASTWLRRRHGVQTAIQQRIRDNLSALRQQMEGSATWVYPVEGGWSAVVCWPGRRDEEECVARLVKEYQVLVHPGYFFDFADDDNTRLVLSLLTPSDIWSSGIKTLKEYILRHTD